ncbi:CoA-binding protein [bacterium]|nr:CoA-binding protein [bacterium]
MPQNKRTLIIGATPNPARYAYIAAQMLSDFNHDIVLFGIKKGEVLGQTILNDWPENEEIDTVTLYINPQIQKQYYDQILNLNPKRIIFNPGTENDELRSLAENKGIETEYACTLVMLRTNQF